MAYVAATSEDSARSMAEIGDDLCPTPELAQDMADAYNRVPGVFAHRTVFAVGLAITVSSVEAVRS
jgi:hypothetical protein